MNIIILIAYLIGSLLSYRFFSTYIVEERDKESVSILIVMSAGWFIVYIIFAVLGLRQATKMLIDYKESRSKR